MVQPNAAVMSGKQPAAKRRKPSSSGDLLDSILGGIDRTMSTTPGAFRAEEEPEVASHYQIVRAPPASDLNRKSMCRNWECGGTEFENDYRSGDRVCRSCGAVQNARNCESQEEEHRTFADDDKKDSKQRTSRSASTGVGMAKLEQANQLAHGQADGDELTHKQRKKIADYKDKVTVLSDALELTDTIKFDGHMLCEDLVRKQHEHDVQCGKGGTCRLTLRLRPAAVIAAALLKEAMRKNGIDRLFEELKKVLKGDDVDAADTGKVGKTHAIVRDLLKGAPYPCADEDSGRAAAAAAQAESLRLGASGSSEGSAAGAAGRGADGSITAAPHPAIALVPRLTTQLHLPYYLERRAVECIEDWSLFGLPALMPQTISALALLRAFEELVQPKLRNGKQNRPLPQLPKLSVADIAQEAGLTEKTLTQHMRHEDLPWPTLLLQDLAHRLAPPPPFAFRTEAQKILDRILQVPGNPAAEATREWSRKLTPRLVAACALLLGARKAAADEAAAATATAITPTEPPDTAAVAAAAGVSPQALDAALAAYPPAQVTM